MLQVSTFEARVRQAVEGKDRAEEELAQAREEIRTMREEMDLTRRKFDLREKLLGEKEKANAVREAHLNEQLEMLKQDREDILLKLDYSPDSTN